MPYVNIRITREGASSAQKASPEISPSDRCSRIWNAVYVKRDGGRGEDGEIGRFGEFQAYLPQPPKRQHVGAALESSYGDARARAAMRKVSRIG